ncbi:hypothetical protein FSP39_020312 [Pinctada imbricata]|uniref:Mitotic-spindle organizing protein 1 n=1 Tax=Pinctada imbricata TaxID=66713 RepID=A0AA89C2I3_PINIB|nr:hypothetical protein FSP39_020312 [Pinctada imbricata]
MADSGKRKPSAARETIETLIEISKLLNTGLDAETLATCVRLCENGVNPEALAHVIQELRRESAAVKNSEKEVCDYTIHEVHRYCELLLSGDHRCIETLYLHPSTVYKSSDEYSQLCSQRHLFCKRNCLDKYLRDATGSKGTKLFDRWISELQHKGTNLEDDMPQKLNKLAYVIIRLLQNAKYGFK